MIGNGDERLVAQALQPQGVFVEDLTRRSEFDGFAGAIEKPVSVFLFQLADLRAHRRLRAEHFFSGAREAALARNFQKCNELIEVHSVWKGNYIGLFSSDAEKYVFAAMCRVLVTGAATGYSNSCLFPVPSVPYRCPKRPLSVRAADGP